jgi:hypothetical protein
MKHFGKGASAALLVTTLVWAFIGCDALSQDKLILESITITSQPTKTSYVKGEGLDLSGLVVTGTYSDGTTRKETVSLSAISGYNADTIGQQTLTVTVDGKTAQFSITVNAVGAPTLSSIAVTTPPTKTAYAIGEDLDLSGIVVTGTYSDGNTKQESVSLSAISGYNANTIGQQTLTVTVNGKTATFAVTVNAGTLQSIAIDSPPAKTTYTVGESLDLTGLVVTGTYSDETTKTESVGLSAISGYNADTIGQQTLTVTVNSKTATFIVTVNAATLTGIAIDSPPTKTTYDKGETLDLSGLVVTGTYSDGNTKSETVDASNVSGYNADTLGEQTLTVTVSGKTAQFRVTVNPATLQSIAVTTMPTKTTYAKGDPLDLTGLEVTGTYSDKTTKSETVGASNVNGYNADTLGEQTLTVTVSGKTAQFRVTVNPATLVSIEITSPPTKTVYAKGEALNLNGLVVTGTYSDNTTKTESVSLADVSGYNADETGEQILTVTVGGETAAFIVNVQTITAFTLTLNFNDPLNELMENIALSKTGAGETQVAVVIETTGTYTEYAWYLNDGGAPVSTDGGYTLNAADCHLGPNFLTVEVRTAVGAYYAKEITITVTK